MSLRPCRKAEVSSLGVSLCPNTHVFTMERCITVWVYSMDGSALDACMCAVRVLSLALVVSSITTDSGGYFWGMVFFGAAMVLVVFWVQRLVGSCGWSFMGSVASMTMFVAVVVFRPMSWLNGNLDP